MNRTLKCRKIVGAFDNPPGLKFYGVQFAITVNRSSMSVSPSTSTSSGIHRQRTQPHVGDHGEQIIDVDDVVAVDVAGSRLASRISTTPRSWRWPTGRRRASNGPLRPEVRQRRVGGGVTVSCLPSKTLTAAGVGLEVEAGDADQAVVANRYGPRTHSPRIPLAWL